MIEIHSQQTIPLGELKVAEYNPREMPALELRKLMRSLEEFGFVEPVVAREEDRLVIGGHQRIEAMRRLLVEKNAKRPAIEATKIPVVLLRGVDDTRAKLLNLALNKIHGQWDYDKLSELLSSLPELDTSIVSISGFDSVEIEDIMALVGRAVEPVEIGDTDALDAEIADGARRFSFKMKDDETANEVRDVLRLYGMTGTSSMVGAFLAAMRSAKAQHEMRLMAEPQPEKEKPDGDNHKAVRGRRRAPAAQP